MTRKPYKAHKRGAGRHVQLAEWLQATAAWATLTPGPGDAGAGNDRG